MSTESAPSAPRSKLATVAAFAVCSLPALFAFEIFLLVVVAIPIFVAMFADFGARLPTMTEAVLRWRWLVLAAAILAAVIPAVRFWPRGLTREHVAVAAALGAFNFMLAQAALFALFLPVFQLGAVVDS